MTIVYAIAVLGVLAIVFGLILAVAAKVFEVEVDPRLPEIQACLAGANCGGCGYPGCGGCAEAILAGKAPVTACAPAGPENAAKIAAIMGMEAPSGDKMVAHVLCNGGCNAKDNFEYRGVKDCLAATKVCGGDAKACRYGCFGFGSCVAACKFDAIHVINGVAVVDKEKCTNCGACRAACPHHLIVEVPYKQKVFVNCSNKDKGPAVTKVCANSCIACGMCERTCKFDAIHVVDNVAVIDYSKCKNCTMCAKACPRNAIEPIPTPEEKEKFKAAQKAAAEKKAAAAKEKEINDSVTVKPKPKLDFDTIVALLRMGSHAIRRFFRSFTVNFFQLHYTVACRDPYDTAIQYGMACAAAETLPALAGKKIRVLRRDIEIGADYTSEEPTVSARIVLSLQLFRLVHLAVALGAEFLKWKINSRPEDKPAAATNERKDDNGRE